MTGTNPAVVLMWEVRATESRLAELVEWLRTHAHTDAQIFRSDEQSRVVVIAENLDAIADVPGELLARPAQLWPFDRVHR